jgi:hypothetical protein
VSAASVWLCVCARISGSTAPVEKKMHSPGSLVLWVARRKLATFEMLSVKTLVGTIELLENRCSKVRPVQNRRRARRPKPKCSGRHR